MLVPDEIAFYYYLFHADNGKGDGNAILFVH